MMKIDRETLEEVEAALDGTRHLVAEAASTGFNWKDGDWADRLYTNNGTVSAALARLRKAMEAKDVWLGEDVRVCENATADDARLIAMAPDLAAEVLRLRAEVERLTEAMAFYADESTYETQCEPLPCGCCSDLSKPIENDAGAIARAALKGTE